MSEDTRPTLAACPCYRDPKAALAWLEQAFGFEPSLVILGPDGSLAHSEMRYGEATIMPASEWSADHSSPAAVGGRNTQTIHIHLREDVDAHCERAKAAGAEILQPPQTQFYGDRTYRARDPEGHIWTFGQTVQVMTEEEWTKAGGVTVQRRL
jgi:uncharacterized glyoxalase superfamily protein PhnB